MNCFWVISVEDDLFLGYQRPEFAQSPWMSCEGPFDRFGRVRKGVSWQWEVNSQSNPTVIVKTYQGCVIIGIWMLMLIYDCSLCAQWCCTVSPWLNNLLITDSYVPWFCVLFHMLIIEICYVLLLTLNIVHVRCMLLCLCYRNYNMCIWVLMIRAWVWMFA